MVDTATILKDFRRYMTRKTVAYGKHESIGNGGNFTN